MLRDSRSPRSPSLMYFPIKSSTPPPNLTALEKVEGPLSCAVTKSGAWPQAPP